MSEGVPPSPGRKSRRKIIKRSLIALGLFVFCVWPVTWCYGNYWPANDAAEHAKSYAAVQGFRMEGYLAEFVQQPDMFGGCEVRVSFTDRTYSPRKRVVMLLSRSWTYGSWRVTEMTVEEVHEQPNPIRYVRLTGDKFVTECEFNLTRDSNGWAIASRTGQMEVEARYDADDRLQNAKATITNGKSTKVATVQVNNGKAKVERDGVDAQEFDVPKGTIVTSAPDWSDVFLLCRRFDRTKNGTQEYPALWIHPEKPARRLTFTIEEHGTDRIVHDGKGIGLVCFQIHIRDNSAYMAWADADGRMVRLIPLPAKDSAPGMTLEGYEKSAAGLRPKDK